MRHFSIVITALSAGLLAACGGGPGGLGAGPVTPTPANTNIANLTINQTFEGKGNNQQAVFDLRSGTVASTDSDVANLRVAYDASSRSYTVSLNGESATFTPSDLTSNAQGEAKYEQRSANGVQKLTLVTTPYTGQTSNRYVGMGYWQRYSVADNRQSDRFSTFVYGLDTPGGAMPRTGDARYDIDVFGVAATPGYEPVAYQGAGSFDVDFLGGEFAAHAYLQETGLITGGGVVGGGIEMAATGRLGSGEGAFSGYVTVGTSRAQTSGVISGRFFGPGAEEVGASFSASNADGATAVGSFTGQRHGAAGVNLRMTDIVIPQVFFTRGRILQVATSSSGEVQSILQIPVISQLNDRTNGNFSYGPGLSTLPGGAFSASDIVASDDPNFIAYRKTFGDNDVRLKLYKLGTENAELSLTYVGLGRWENSVADVYRAEQQQHHFVYGLETPNQMLNARTGSARYDGVVYGAGANRTTGAIYDVRGSSHFDVNFSNQSYTGALVLNGRAQGQTLDFGRYEFGGRLGWNGNTAPLISGEAEVGEINTRFYGPTGEELAGDFHVYAPESVQAGGLVINGVTAARRR